MNLASLIFGPGTAQEANESAAGGLKLEVAGNSAGLGGRRWWQEAKRC